MSFLPLHITWPYYIIFHFDDSRNKTITILEILVLTVNWNQMYAIYNMNFHCWNGNCYIFNCLNDTCAANCMKLMNWKDPLIIGYSSHTCPCSLGCIIYVAIHRWTRCSVAYINMITKNHELPRQILVIWMKRRCFISDRNPVRRNLLSCSHCIVIWPQSSLISLHCYRTTEQPALIALLSDHRAACTQTWIRARILCLFFSVQSFTFAHFAYWLSESLTGSVTDL